MIIGTAGSADRAGTTVGAFPDPEVGGMPVAHRGVSDDLDTGRGRLLRRRHARGRTEDDAQ